MRPDVAARLIRSFLRYSGHKKADPVLKRALAHKGKILLEKQLSAVPEDQRADLELHADSSIDPVAEFAAAYVSKKCRVTCDISYYITFGSAIVAFISACILATRHGGDSLLKFFVISSSLVTVISSFVGLVCNCVIKYKVRKVKAVITNFRDAASKVATTISTNEEIQKAVINRICHGSDIEASDLESELNLLLPTKPRPKQPIITSTVSSFTPVTSVTTTAGKTIPPVSTYFSQVGSSSSSFRTTPVVTTTPIVSTLTTHGVTFSTPAVTSPITTTMPPVSVISTAAPIITVTPPVSTPVVSTPPVTRPPVVFPKFRLAPTLPDDFFTGYSSIYTNATSTPQTTASTVYVNPRFVPVDMPKMVAGNKIGLRYSDGTICHFAKVAPSYPPGMDKIPNSCLPGSILAMILPTYRQSLDSVYTQFKLARGEKQDTDFAETFAQVNGINIGVYTGSNRQRQPYAFYRSTFKPSQHNTIFLHHKDDHFTPLTAPIAIGCTCPDCASYIETTFNTEVTSISGGAPPSAVKATIAGVTGLVLAVGIISASGLGIELNSTKNILQLFNTASSFSGKAGDFGEYMVKEVFDLANEDADRDMRLLNVLTQYASALNATVPSDLVTDYSLVHEHVHFMTLFNQTLRLVKETPKVLPVIQNLRTLANAITQKVPSMVNALATINDRSPTQFFQLCGPSGIGKSTLAIQVLTEVAKQLDLPPELYNARPNSDGYFGTYAGQRLGFVEEFLLKGSSDEFLPHINMIGSNSAYNMPAAFEKYQYTQLLAVILTSNLKDTPLAGKYTPEGAKALWTRIAPFQVSWKDPTFSINDENRHEKHFRKADWSHVTIQYTPKDGNAKYVTKDQLVTFIVDRLRATIKEEHLRPSSKVTNLKKFRGILDEHMIGYPMEFTPHAKTTTAHIFAMLSGPAGTGKSTLVGETLQPALKLAFPNLKQYFLNTDHQMKSITQNPPVLPGIYIFDDLITKHQTRVHETINALTAPSIIIHTANLREHATKNHLKYAYKSLYSRLVPGYTAEEREKMKDIARLHKTVWTSCLLDEGVLRRSGLSGIHTTTHGTITLDANRSVWYKTRLERSSCVIHQAHSTKPTGPLPFVKEIVDKYKQLCKHSGNIQITTYDTLPSTSDDDYDVVLSFKSLDELHAFVANPVKHASIIVYSPEDARERDEAGSNYVFIHSRVCASYCGELPAPIDVPLNADGLKEVVTHFLSVLWLKAPEASTYIKVGDFKLFAKDGKVLLPPSSGFQLREEGKDIHISFLTSHVIIDKDRLQTLLDNGLRNMDLHQDELFILNNAEEFLNHPLIMALRQEQTNASVQRTTVVSKAIALDKLRKKIMRNKIITILLALTAAFLTVGAIAGIVFAVKRYMAKSSPKPEEETIEQIPASDFEHHAVVSEASDKYPSRRNIHQMYAPIHWTPHATDDVLQIKKIRNNTVFISALGRCQALMLTSKTGVTTAHQMADGAYVTKGSQVIPVESYSTCTERELCFFTLKTEVQGARDIRSLLLPPTTVPDLTSGMFIKDKSTHGINMTYIPYFLTKHYRKDIHFIYRSNTPVPELSKGDCGTPLAHFNPKTRKYHIIGLYCGVGTGYPLAVSLSTDIYTPILHSDETREMEVNGWHYKFYHTEANFIKNGCKETPTIDIDLPILAKTRQVNIPVKDTRVESPFRFSIDHEITKRPGTVTYKDEPGPYHKKLKHFRGKSKYAQLPTLIDMQCEQPTNIDTLILSEAVRQISTFYKQTYGTHGKPLSEEQVLNGFNGTHQLSGKLSALNLKAGSGYVQSTMGAPLKRDLFRRDENDRIVWREDDFVSMWTKLRYKDADTRLQVGDVITFFAIDSLKSELLPAEKVEDGKIRLYQADPVERVLLVRKYFGHIAARMNKYHLNAKAQIGLNPYTDFHPLVARLIKTSITGEDGDFKNFDKSICRRLMIAVCMVLNSCYDDGFDNCRVSLMNSLASTVHVADGHIYATYQGNPSGNAITTVINCVVIDILQAYCYIKAVGTPTGLFQNVDWLSGGDDSITVIHPAIQHVYNPDVKSIILREDFGMTYTASAKDGTGSIARIDTLSFCSRSIHAKPDMIGTHYFFGALKHETMISFLQWTSSLGDMQLGSNIRTFIQEMCFQPEDRINEYMGYVSNIFHTYPRFRTFSPMPFSKTFIGSYALKCIMMKTSFALSSEHNSEDTLCSLELPVQAIATSDDKTTSIYYEVNLFEMDDNPVSTVNSICQKLNVEAPTFDFSHNGPDNKRTFYCSAVWCKIKIYSVKGSTKKIAKANACRALLEALLDSSNTLTEGIARFCDAHDVTLHIEWKEGSYHAGFYGVSGLRGSGSGSDPATAIECARIALQSGVSICPGTGARDSFAEEDFTPHADYSEGSLPLVQASSLTEVTEFLPNLIAGAVPPIVAGFDHTEPNLETKAREIWSVVDRVTYDSTQTRGTVLYQAPYHPAQFLSGYAAQYAKQHQKCIGGIDLKIEIEGNVGAKGTVQMGVIRSSVSTTGSITDSHFEDVGTKKEYKVGGLTKESFNVPFAHPHDRYWTPTSTATSDYTLVVVAGNKVTGVALSSEDNSSVDIVISARPAADWNAYSAVLDQTALPPTLSGPVDEIVGKDFASLLKLDGPIYLSFDGYHPTMTALTVPGSDYEPTWRAGTSITSWPIGTGPVLAGITPNVCAFNFTGKPYTDHGGSTQFRIEDFGYSSDPQPRPLSEWVNDATWENYYLYPSKAIPFTPDSGDVLTVPAVDGRLPTRHAYLIGDTAHDFENATASTTSTGNLTVTAVNGASHVYTGCTIKEYEFSDGRLCAYITSPEGVVVTFGSQFVATGNQVQYHNPSSSYATETHCTNLETKLRGPEWNLQSVGLSNRVVTYSSASEKRYPQAHFRRCHLGSIPVPPTTVKSGQPTLIFEKKIREAIDNFRSRISSDQFALLVGADPVFRSPAFYIAIPGNPEIAPYAITDPTGYLYATLGADVSNYIIKEASIKPMGATMQSIPTQSFIDRNTEINADLFAEQAYTPHASIAAILGASLVGGALNIGGNIHNVNSMINSNQHMQQVSLDAVRVLTQASFEHQKQMLKAGTALKLRSDLAKYNMYGPGTKSQYNINGNKTSAKTATTKTPRATDTEAVAPTTPYSPRPATSLPAIQEETDGNTGPTQGKNSDPANVVGTPEYDAARRYAGATVQPPDEHIYSPHDLSVIEHEDWDHRLGKLSTMPVPDRHEDIRKVMGPSTYGAATNADPSIFASRWKQPNRGEAKVLKRQYESDYGTRFTSAGIIPGTEESVRASKRGKTSIPQDANNAEQDNVSISSVSPPEAFEYDSSRSGSVSSADSNNFFSARGSVRGSKRSHASAFEGLGDFGSGLIPSAGSGPAWGPDSILVNQYIAANNEAYLMGPSSKVPRSASPVRDASGISARDRAEAGPSWL